MPRAEYHRGKANRTRCVQLTALSEACGLCALQEKGAASNCDGYAPVMLRSAHVLYAWGSEQQPKRKASMCFLDMSCCMIKWATAMVNELGNVANVTANRMMWDCARSLQVLDLKAAVTPSPLGSACAYMVNARMLVVVYLSWLVMWEPGGC